MIFESGSDPGNGYALWELFTIAFDDPTNPGNVFYADIAIVNNTPVITPHPDRRNHAVYPRFYKLLAKPALDASGGWEKFDGLDSIPEGMRFFKVEVDVK